jgi:hypothetical protein
MAKPDLPREELEATLAARRELGREREPELVDSFLAKIEREIDERVEQRLAHRRERPRHPTTTSPWVAIASLGIGIGVTGTITGNSYPSWVVAVAWLAIVLVNIVYYRRPD